MLKDEHVDPVWNEQFRIYCCHTVEDVTVSMKDATIVGTVVVGRTHNIIELQYGGIEAAEVVDKLESRW